MHGTSPKVNETGFSIVMYAAGQTCESRAPTLPRGVVPSRHPLLELSMVCRLDLDVKIDRDRLLSTFGMMGIGVGASVRSDSTPHPAKRLESSTIACVCRVVVSHLGYTLPCPSTYSG